MKILMIAPLNSQHVVRWMNQLKDTDWDIHIFKASYSQPSIATGFAIGDIILPYWGKQQAQSPHAISPKSWFDRLQGYAIPRIRLLEQNLLSRQLVQVIKDFQPDVVHSHAIYAHNSLNFCLPVLMAYQQLGDQFGAWVVTPWATDVDYFPNLNARYRQEIEMVLPHIPYCVTECDNDLHLAQSLGFRGERVLRTLAHGAIEHQRRGELIFDGKSSARNRIFIKGRAVPYDPVGRAMTVMHAIEQIADRLQNTEIVIGQATPNVREAAARLTREYRLNIRVLERLPYDDLLRLIGSSRLYCSATTVDGLPSSLMESVWLGCLPIFADLNSIREVITSGTNGILCPPEDVDAYASAILRGLQDDELVDTAAQFNHDLIRDHYAADKVIPQVIAMYEQLAQRA